MYNETLTNKKEIIATVNRNLLITVDSLANYYTSQYLTTNSKEEPEKAASFHFGALENRAIVMDLCVGFDAVEMFNSAVNSANLIVDDFSLSDEDKKTILDILSDIPDSWKTTEFKSFVKKLV